MSNGRIQQRIDPKLQEEAESILRAQGIKPSQAITMFYTEIKRKKGLPFFPSELSEDELRKAVEPGEEEGIVGLGGYSSNDKEDFYDSLKEV